jgi:hypothetical protein
MTNPECHETDRHKLQMEFAGGGPGSIIRTAIGADSDGGGDAFLDPAWLPDPAWWFFLLEKKVKVSCREKFQAMDLVS